jgi:hypothetical protein
VGGSVRVDQRLGVFWGLGWVFCVSLGDLFFFVVIFFFFVFPFFISFFIFFFLFFSFPPLFFFYTFYFSFFFLPPFFFFFLPFFFSFFFILLFFFLFFFIFYFSLFFLFCFFFPFPLFFFVLFIPLSFCFRLQQWRDQLAVNGKVVTTGKDVSQRKRLPLPRIRRRPDQLPQPAHQGTSADGKPRLQIRRAKGRRLQIPLHGLDLSGWTTTEQGQSAWQPKDWMLRFDPAKDLKPTTPESLILRTEKKLKDFELILDYRQRGPGDIQLILRGVSIKLRHNPKTNPPGTASTSL